MQLFCVTEDVSNIHAGSNKAFTCNRDLWKMWDVKTGKKKQFPLAALDSFTPKQSLVNPWQGLFESKTEGKGSLDVSVKSSFMVPVQTWCLFLWWGQLFKNVLTTRKKKSCPLSRLTVRCKDTNGVLLWQFLSLNASTFTKNVPSDWML